MRLCLTIANLTHNYHIIYNVICQKSISLLTIMLEYVILDIKEVIMNTEFYRQLLSKKRELEYSTRRLAKECGICYGTLVNFFNPNKPRCPLREITMARINNKLGISYEVMEEYNREILKERGN